LSRQQHLSNYYSSIHLCKPKVDILAHYLK
jgi:hypothetical protein